MEDRKLNRKDPKLVAFEIFDALSFKEEILVSTHAPRKPELFIWFGKEYIDQGGAIEFSGDYTRIRKITPWEEIEAIANQII